MKYYAIDDKKAELYQYGIPGQKWGRRRFQNEDGTFNELGKKRYFETTADKGSSSTRYTTSSGSTSSSVSTPAVSSTSRTYAQVYADAKQKQADRDAARKAKIAARGNMQEETINKTKATKTREYVDPDSDVHVKSENRRVESDSATNSKKVVTSSESKVETNTQSQTSKEDLVAEIINGDWGNGSERIKALQEAGYDPAEIQKLVDQARDAKSSETGYKSTDAIVAEVINGNWGNGTERIKALRAAGYDPIAIQKLVDKVTAEKRRAKQAEILVNNRRQQVTPVKGNKSFSRAINQ